MWLCVSIDARNILHSHGDRSQYFHLCGRKSCVFPKLHGLRQQICLWRIFDRWKRSFCFLGEFYNLLLKLSIHSILNSVNLQVLPVLFFFSFIVSVLYYWNVMQWIVLKLGWVLQTILGTTICESVVAAANIFLGMTASPLLIRPYIQVTAHLKKNISIHHNFTSVTVFNSIRIACNYGVWICQYSCISTSRVYIVWCRSIAFNHFKYDGCSSRFGIFETILSRRRRKQNKIGEYYRGKIVSRRMLSKWFLKPNLN